MAIIRLYAMPKCEAIPTDTKVEAGSAGIPRLPASDTLKQLAVPVETARTKVVKPCAVSSNVGTKPVRRVSQLLAKRISYKAASAPTATSLPERFALTKRISGSATLTTSKQRRLK